jgi:Mrp family chromosome partitioning ATPase
MENDSAPTRYLTLRDYLQVVRRYWIAIVVITVIGAAAGFATAKSQTSSYTAAALLSYQDPSQDLTLVGLAPVAAQQPNQLAVTDQDTLTRAGVMTAVQRDLHTTASIPSLSGAVSSTVTPGGLLQVNASASDPTFAKRFANAMGAAITSDDNRAARRVFANAAAQLRTQIASERAHLSTPGVPTELYVDEAEVPRLEALAKFGQSARVVQPATLPTSASSPNVLRSTLIGLALGLLLALVVAFVRDTLDRRLRSGNDVESSFDFPVIGHVSNRALGRIANNAAKTDDSRQVDVEAFRILRRNLLNFDSRPRTIVVTSAVAEEGKTTVAGSLAFAMASAGMRTLLVECDLRRPALGQRLGIPVRPGMSDFLAGSATPQEILRTIEFTNPAGSTVASSNGGGVHTAATGLVAIPAGSPASDSAELLGSARFREFLDQVVGTYDIVVIDSSPLLPVSDTLEMLPHVDAVVVCARDSKTTREEAVAVNKALARFPSLSVGVVITGLRTSRSDYAVYTRAHTYA